MCERQRGGRLDKKHNFNFYWHRVHVEPVEYGPRSDVKKGRLLNNSSKLIKSVELYRCRRRPLGEGGGMDGGGEQRLLRGRKAAFKGSFVESQWGEEENKAKRPTRLRRLFDVLICCTFAPSFLFRTDMWWGGWRGVGAHLWLHGSVCVCERACVRIVRGPSVY